MPWTAGNSIVTGEYILTAAGKVTQWNSRGIALAVVTFAFAINAFNAKIGLWVANTLGSFKIIIIAFIIITGWVGLGNGIKSKISIQLIISQMLLKGNSNWLWYR